MANKFLSGINVTGTTTLNTVANAGTDTDKFLVLDASGNVDFRTGDELYADLGIGSLPAGFTSTLKHAVKAGVSLTKGQAVYVTSADGTNMIVGKASNASEATSSKTLGLIETSLSTNGIGNVITEGLLTGLDTTGAAAAGDPVWLGTDGNLIYGLLNKPYAPAHLVFIGVVTRRNANNGEIFVKVQNGFELNEIHDIDLKTTTPINGHILGYDGTLWVNKTVAGWLGYTPVTNARTLTINGTTYDLSADRSWTITSMIYPSSGIAVSTGTAWGTSITDNSSNWNTAYGWGNHASAGYVPGARELTINGTTYDLTANRSWTIDSTTASTRTIQKFTSTSSQTTFTITGGYTVGMVDVWVNGVKLDNAVDFTASNGTTVVLTDALTANQIVEVYKYGSQFIINNGLRQKTLFTATAGQTSFTVAYSVGLVDVFYNGSKLDDSEFTATNGTSIVLGTACAVNDKVEVIAFSYNVNGFTGIGGSGTTNYIPKFTASGTIGNSAITDDGTTVTLVSRALSGTSATFTGHINLSGSAEINHTGRLILDAGAGNGFLFRTDNVGVDALTIASNGSSVFSSSVTANSIIKSGGTSAQFLKADGSVDSTTYASGNFYVIDYLVVAGGGGGGGAEMSNGYGGGGSGGGAGGYLASTTGITVGSSYTVIVGAGGAGGASRLAENGSGLAGSNGGYSKLFHTICLGGGQGQGDETINGSALASTGGSGGGNGGDSAAGPGLGTPGQGNNGGGRGSTRSGGGGGGANTSGGESVVGSRGGLGGNGLTWFDTNIYSCGGGGGGGGAVVDNAAGGNSSINGGIGSKSTGGGGTTGEAGGNATPGTANTGTGGGGAGAGFLQGGQNGGSGIVIIRYAGAQRGTGGTVTSSGGYTYHRFTSSGTFTA